MPNKEGFN